MYDHDDAKNSVLLTVTQFRLIEFSFNTFTFDKL